MEDDQERLVDYDDQGFPPPPFFTPLDSQQRVFLDPDSNYPDKDLTLDGKKTQFDDSFYAMGDEEQLNDWMEDAGNDLPPPPPRYNDFDLVVYGFLVAAFLLLCVFGVMCFGRPKRWRHLVRASTPYVPVTITHLAPEDEETKKCPDSPNPSIRSEAELTKNEHITI